MTEKKTKIEVRELYKIFGGQPEIMVEKVKQGMSKPELLKEHGHVLGLENINVDMKAGDITVIMGLSGSGKSTLIRHLNRLIEPTSGEVLIDGKNVLDASEAELRDLRNQRMSMVFQNFGLLPHRTVLHNTALGLEIRGEPQEASFDSARKWLARVGLKGFEEKYPHQLSGGMQQRVGIARALCSEAEIMLMDEAFSALDPIIRTDMQSLLLELQTELHKTIIFITHDLDEALRLADHLVVLKNGRIVQQGEPQSIILHPEEDYIRNFVRDVNRARVLRLRSIMAPFDAGVEAEFQIDDQASLEDVIALTSGRVDANVTAVSAGKPVGSLSMSDLMKALVPAHQVAAE